MVTHNRALIDDIVDTIWEVQNDGTIRVFKGNYSQYHAQLEQEYIEHSRQYQQYQSEKTN